MLNYLLSVTPVQRAMDHKNIQSTPSFDDRGAGGKLTRPNRTRPSATPYSRPPESGRGQWFLSKVIGGATRVVSSFFSRPTSVDQSDNDDQEDEEFNDDLQADDDSQFEEAAWIPEVELNNHPEGWGDQSLEESLEEKQLETDLEVSQTDYGMFDEEGFQQGASSSNVNPSGGACKTLKTLNNDERQSIYVLLLRKSNDGKLPRGLTRMIATQYSTSMSTIQRLWKNSNNTCDPRHRKTKNCGRKRIEVDMELFRDLPLNKRKNLRVLSTALNVSKDTLHRRCKSGEIKRHSNSIKPFLTEENKRERLKFCLSMLNPGNTSFRGMYDIIHIDEKWFYMTKKAQTYYLHPDEEEPYRTCKSKSFIPKVMFLAAVCRPRFGEEGDVIFSGKIGLFPFVIQEPAKRKSRHRARGTLETKPIASVKREIMKAYMIEKLLPAIREKWPVEDSRCRIYIQQDNCRVHIKEDDVDFCEAAAQTGLDIQLMCQPPNSPDMNILDLGFFNAIQSLQHRESHTTIDGLINAVVKAFIDFPIRKSNHLFLTLQACMKEVMKINGSNRYKIPHLEKERLERNGMLPSRLSCDPSLVQNVLDHLSTNMPES